MVAGRALVSRNPNDMMNSVVCTRLLTPVAIHA